MKMNNSIKILLFYIALFFSISANAQISKGKSMVGGSLSFSFSPSGNGAGHFVSTGNYGYLITDKFMLTAGFALISADGWANREFGYYHRDIQYGLGIAPRYYLENNFFIEGGINRTREKFDDLFDVVSIDNLTAEKIIYVRHDFYLSLGKTLFITDHIAFEPMAGYFYSNAKFKDINTSPYTNYTFLGPFAQFQFAFYFGGK